MASIDAAIHAILVALGKRLPTDNLIATAKAKLVYEPADAAQRAVSSIKSWLFTAPLGPIEAGELRWYLEKYALWPS